MPLLGAMVGCHGRVPLLGATVLGCTFLCIDSAQIGLCYLGSMLVYLFIFKYSIYIYISVLMFVSCLEIFL